jgi:hypothetical protein
MCVGCTAFAEVLIHMQKWVAGGNVHRVAFDVMGCVHELVVVRVKRVASVAVPIHLQE